MINEQLKRKLNQMLVSLILVSLKMNHFSKSLFNINLKICIINFLVPYFPNNTHKN
jgi:hypothetical protein